MRQIAYSQRLKGRLTPVGTAVHDASLAGMAEPATVDAQLAFTDEHNSRLLAFSRLACVACGPAASHVWLAFPPSVTRSEASGHEGAR